MLRDEFRFAAQAFRVYRLAAGQVQILFPRPAKTDNSRKARRAAGMSCASKPPP
jgi:hypothetical protein